MKILGLVLVLALLVPNVISSTILKVPAVTNNNQGVITQIEVSITKTPKLVITGAKTIGDQTIYSSLVAYLIAQLVTGSSKFGVNINFLSPSDDVNGPSASALITTAIIALRNEKYMNNSITMSGMINPDMTVGPIGGLNQKILAAKTSNITAFLVPWSEFQAYSKSEPSLLPIYTIFQSYNYYTGSKIALKQINLSQLLFKQAYLKLYNYYLNISQNKSIGEVSQYAEKGMFYIASSLLLAKIVDFFERESVQNSTKALLELNKAKSLINKLSFPNFTSASIMTIDSIITALDRYRESNYFLTQAEHYFNEGNFSGSLFYSDLAILYFNITLSWLNLITNSGQQINLSLLSYKALSIASLVLNYLNSLSASSPQIMNYLSNNMSLAYRYFDNKNYLFSIYYSYKVIYYSILLFHEAFGEIPSKELDLNLINISNFLSSHLQVVPPSIAGFTSYSLYLINANQTFPAFNILEEAISRLLIYDSYIKNVSLNYSANSSLVPITNSTSNQSTANNLVFSNQIYLFILTLLVIILIPIIPLWEEIKREKNM
jgi:uncharacterized protein